MENSIGKLAVVLIDVTTQLKIYHWQTKLYSKHKASCDLINKITEITDKILETMQGIHNIRLKIDETYNKLIVNNQNDESINGLLRYFSNWLIEKFPNYIDKKYSDIYNLRDELLSEIHQTLYLFTFE